MKKEKRIKTTFVKLIIFIVLVSLCFSSSAMYAESDEIDSMNTDQIQLEEVTYVGSSEFIRKEGLSDLEHARNNMINIGVPEDIINDMPESEILTCLDIKSAMIKTEYYQYDYEAIYNEDTKEYEISMNDKIQISKDDAYRKAKECNEEISKINVERIKYENPEVVKAAGWIFEDGYNYGSNYFGSAVLQIETYATHVPHIGSNEYQLASTFEWLSYPPNRQEDVFGIVNDAKATKLQNTNYFIAKAHRKYSDYTPPGTVTYDIITLRERDSIESNKGDEESVDGVAFTYELPNDSWSSYFVTQYRPFGYVRYHVEVPTESNTFVFAASYGHNSSYTNWDGCFSISYPAGISVSNPSLQTKTQIYNVICNYKVKYK